MSLNFSSRSSSKSSSKSQYTEQVNSEADLKEIIKDARENGIKNITVEDHRSSPLRIGTYTLHGTKVDVSLFSSREKTYTINFA